MAISSQAGAGSGGTYSFIIEAFAANASGSSAGFVPAQIRLDVLAYEFFR
ncbi:hypothetical protein [Paucimonas lemoignei]|nr:hypothetical protein [Paucimonas lemoignei]